MRLFQLKKYFLALFFVFVAVALNYFISYEKMVFAEVDPSLVSERRQLLEQELSALESQIGAYRTTIEEKQREATTLERDIDILTAQINKAQLEVRARDLSINKLVDNIENHTIFISDLSKKIDREKSSLAELLRRVDEMDSTPLIEVVLGYERFSDFFADIDNFESINQAVHASVAVIRQTRISTEEEKEELESKKGEEMELRSLQVLERNRKKEAESNKNNLLKLTKGKEKEYQQLLTARQKDAAKIRSQLFMLRGSPAIPFEKALEYAIAVSKITDVRPAFLLGVIAEESNLGANVGTGNWKIDLSHARCANQRRSFVEITAELGFDPDLMPVSKKAWYGYCGGAMGPAQFMPTTWKLYVNGVKKITGHNPPNPWDPFDAFAAASLLLSDNGAINGNYNSERKAALKYLAGSNWNKSAYSFYGDDVMALAAKYQEQIDIISR